MNSRIPAGQKLKNNSAVPFGKQNLLNGIFNLSRYGLFPAYLSSVTVSPEILVLAEKAEHYLSEGALSRDMVTDYVKEVKIYGVDDYRITWKYPELFEEMRRKADGMETELNYNPRH